MSDISVHPVLRKGFDPSDDPSLWEAAWKEIVAPLEHEAERLDRRMELYVQIGRCSHWLRPHQTRLTVAGGFAWPCGYEGGRYSRLGLPGLEWYAILRWSPDDSRWVAGRHFRGKRRVVCRVAVPGRTARHAQAVVHVRWEPGTIDSPHQKRTQYFAFRRGDQSWECVAARDLYEHGAA
jgi:hypothetical protein